MKKTPTSPEIILLNSVLQKTITMTSQLDTQINIAVAISSAIFVFSATTLANSGPSASFLVLGGFAGISTIIALLAVQPPNFLNKSGQKESLFYHRKIFSYASSDEYEKVLRELSKSTEKMQQEYAKEIYNIAKYYYAPKRKLFELARNFLIIGFVLSLGLFLKVFF